MHQVINAMRKVQTLIKVTQSVKSVVVENHQSENPWCFGSIVTHVVSGPTLTVPLEAIQQHVASFVHTVFINETSFFLLTIF